MKYQAIPCDIKQYHTISRITIQYHAIPCNNKQHYQVDNMQFPASSGFWLRVKFESSNSKKSELVQFVKKSSNFPHVLYIRTDRKEKFEYKIVDDIEQIKLSSQYFTERTSVIECAIVQKYLVFILLTTQSE